jgi:signal transduction histidine kinase
MRAVLAFLVSARIGTQIAVLVVGALVLAHLAMAAAFLTLHPIRPEQDSPFAAIERLVLVARMIEAEPDAGKRAALLAQAQRAKSGLSVLLTAPAPEPAVREARLLQDLQARLGPGTDLFLAQPDRSQSGARSVVARLPDGTLLAVSLPQPLWDNVFLSPVTIGTLAFLASAVIILSWWAAWQLTAPLRKFADAATRFTVDAAGPPIPEQGPLEVRRAAKALNDMQARLAKLIADRTRMLAAVSHDLRTPITRLRLRAEDVANEELRAQVLRDLGTMQNLVQSVLSFLRGQHEGGPAIKTDLPPLVQTVCDGFSDMGHSVHYSGVPHLYAHCEPDQLMRAIENLIDNGLKFGTAVEVRVEQCDRAAVIEVQDNGPGIAVTEKARVIEPFYRGDTARNLSEGDSFGLGLSIAHAIIERNGGKLDLLDGAPAGLLARITLPALTDH